MDYGRRLDSIISKKFLPLVLWCVLIFIGSSIPGASVSKNPLVDFILHKGVHIIEYFFLFVFSYRVFGKKALLSFTFVFFYSLLDEFHQRFVPGRNGRIEDTFVDLTGAFFGFIFVWKLLHILPNRLRNWLLA